MRYTLFFVILLGFFISVPAAQAKIYNQTEIQQAVTRFFKDTPEMVAIAKCESEFRQYTDAGNTLRGGANNRMIGVYQVNEVYHRQTAELLGHNIDTLMGNLLYAKHLLLTQGLEPWWASKYCWGPLVSTYSNAANSVASYAAPSTAYADTSTDDEEEEDDDEMSEDEREDAFYERFNSSSKKLRGEFTKRLEFLDVHPQARLLQQLLNQEGYTVAESGPGSPGRETDKFGYLTLKALIAFQCDNNIMCPTKDNIEKFGELDRKTRKALNKLLD